MTNDRGRRGGRANAKSGRATAKGRGGGADAGQQDGGRTGTAGGTRGGRTSARRGGRGGAGGRGQQRQQQQESIARLPAGDPRVDGRLRPAPGRGASPDKESARRAEAPAAAAVTPRITRQNSGKRDSGSASGASVEASAGADSASNRRSAAKRAKTGDPKVLWSPGKRARTASPAAVGAGGAGVGDNSRGGKGIGALAVATSGPNLDSLAKSFKERHGEDIGLGQDDSDGDGEGGESTAPSSRPLNKRLRSRNSGTATEAAVATAEAMSPEKLAAEIQKARARAREERFGGNGANVRASPAGSRRPLLARKTAAGEQATVVARGASGTSTETRAHEAAKAMADNVGASTSSTSPAASSPRGNMKASSSPTRATPGASGAASVASAASREAADSSVGDPNTLTSPVPQTVSRNQGVSTNTSKSTGAAPKQPDITTKDASNARPSSAGDKTLPSQQGRTPDPGAGAPAKVHTLRLKLRADTVGDSQPQPKHGSGVEEWRRSGSSNAGVVNGVEECKACEPTNTELPSTSSASDAVSFGTTGTSSSLQKTSQHFSDESNAVAPQSTSNARSVTQVTSSGGSAPSNSTLPRSTSWGPSFGIASAAEASSTAAQPGAGPKLSAPSNPWILSPDAPTFAKNQGRPLSQSLPQSSSRPAGQASTGAARTANANSERTTGIGRISSAERPSSGGGGTLAQGDKPDSASGAAGMQSVATASFGRQGGQVEERQLPAGSRDSGIGSQADAAQQGAGGATQREAVTGASVGGDTGVLDTEEEEGVQVASSAEELILGVRVSGSVKDLLERLKKEREESLNLERKLTRALLDL